MSKKRNTKNNKLFLISASPSVKNISNAKEVLIDGGDYYLFNSLEELLTSKDLADELDHNAPIFEISIKKVGTAIPKAESKYLLDLRKE
jgi:hypothetical protein